jgi:hypothetical protein
MSAIGSAIYSILANDAGVAALVSTRIYPTFVPQGASMPAITYQRIVAVRDHVLDGTTEMVAATYQINCWAETYAETRALSDAVRAALDDYEGTVNSVVIQNIHLTDEDDLSDRLPGDDVLNRHAKRLDFEVWFNE